MWAGLSEQVQAPALLDVWDRVFSSALIASLREAWGVILSTAPREGVVIESLAPQRKQTVLLMKRGVIRSSSEAQRPVVCSSMRLNAPNDSLLAFARVSEEEVVTNAKATQSLCAAAMSCLVAAAEFKLDVSCRIGDLLEGHSGVQPVSVRNPFAAWAGAFSQHRFEPFSRLFPGKCSSD